MSRVSNLREALRASSTYQSRHPPSLIRGYFPKIFLCEQVHEGNFIAPIMERSLVLCDIFTEIVPVLFHLSLFLRGHFSSCGCHQHPRATVIVSIKLRSRRSRVSWCCIHLIAIFYEYPREFLFSLLFHGSMDPSKTLGRIGIGRIVFCQRSVERLSTV